MSVVDKWLGEEFNQEVLWDPDSLAFRRAKWENKDVVSGVQMKTAQIKMWDSKQTVSYITFSPNLLSVCLGWTDEEGTVEELASSHEDVLFAINGGESNGSKPADYFKLDGSVVNPQNTSTTANGVVGLKKTALGNTMEVSGKVENAGDYFSSMVAGPLLVSGGEACEFPEGPESSVRMARTIVGVTKTGNYVFGVVDGGAAGQAEGATLKEAASLALLMGMEEAISFSSGDNVTLWSSENGVMNNPSGGSAKKMATIMYVKPGSAKVSGKGTAEDPYLMESHVHMTQMRTLTAPGTTTYFKLTQDVDMSLVKSWTPVNYDGDYSRQIHFDGNGNSLINFSPEEFVNDTDASKVASYPSLFGVLYGSCKNLTIKDSRLDVGAKASVGFLGGYVGTSGKPAEVDNVHLLNCEIEGTCNSEKLSGYGGFGGQSREATFKNCSADIKILAGGTDVGGMVGKAHTTISFENCTAKVYLSPKENPGGNMRYGGLLGWGNCTEISVRNCSTSGTIVNDKFSCNASSGIVAYSGSSISTVISQCKTSVNLERKPGTSNLSNTGGMVGCHGGAGSCTIENCYSTGDLVVHQTSGGLVGRHEKGTLTINNSYSTSSIDGFSGLGSIVGQSAGGTVLKLSGCIAWSPSITASRSGADKYSSGAIVGAASGTSTITGCVRRSDMVFSDPFRTGLVMHNDLGGVVHEGAANQQAYDGKTTSAETVSAAAKAASWDEAIWDLSGSAPELKIFK